MTIYKRIGISIILCIILAAACACGMAGEPRLPDRVMIDGLDVSGLTVAEAREKLSARHEELLRNARLVFRLGEKTVSCTALELPVSYDIEAALSEASNLSRMVLNTAPMRNVTSALVWDMPAAAATLAGRLAALDVPAQDAAVDYDPGAEGSFLYQPEVSGKLTDPAATATALAASFRPGEEQELEVPYTETLPAVTLEILKFRHTLVSEFTTSYKKSPLNAKGRVHNIAKAAGIIDGTVIAPGETFDTNAILGPRNAENGWKQAPGILNGKYEMEYGGGVCQVSSTLFNAVMLADLEVTQRTPHSWPSSYVPIGRDATISTGGPNFRFVNSYDVPLLVSARANLEELTLTIRIYSAPLPDGVTVKITSKRTGTLKNPGSKVVLDRSLPPNTRVVDRESRSGSTSVTYKEYYDANGELLERIKAYEDTYRPIEGLIYLSEDLYYPKPSPSPTPATPKPSPTPTPEPDKPSLGFGLPDLF